jgi:hypothetical protein
MGGRTGDEGAVDDLESLLCAHAARPLEGEARAQLDALLERLGLPRDLTKIGGLVRAEPKRSPGPARGEPVLGALVTLFRSPMASRVEAAYLTFFPGVSAAPLADAIAENGTGLVALALINGGEGTPLACALRRAALGALRQLDLTLTRLKPLGVETLCAAPWLAGLEGLVLERCEIGDLGMAALARAEMPQLRVLDLTQASLEADGIRALAAWPSLANVDTLKLRRNKLGLAGVEALLASPHLGRLTTLDLGQCDLDPAAAEKLAAWPALAGLTKLSLDGNKIRLLEEDIWGETSVLYTLPADEVAQRIRAVLGERVRF